MLCPVARYAQERALTEQMDLAAEVGLPLVLYHVQVRRGACGVGWGGGA